MQGLRNVPHQRRCAVKELSDSGPHPDLSGVVRLRSEVKPPQLITRDNYKDLKSIAPAANDVPAKLRYLSRHVGRKSQHPGDGVEVGHSGCPVQLSSAIRYNQLHDDNAPTGVQPCPKSSCYCVSPLA